jgi:D-alanyl-D-alanine carboxypeptidase/D-alanyl-D-alanine-endopeptidase (penicillin-binding protein 4)
MGDDSRYDAERYIPSWPNRYKREDTVGPVSALIVNDGVTGYVATPSAASKVRQPGDPPVLAADTLKTLLKERGITVTGAAVAGRAPAATTEIARLETPMQDEIAEMLSWSDNTTAESLTKELGLETARAGTTAAGLAAVRAALDADGLPTAGLVLNDGSGLDEGNRLTCDLVTALLDRHGPTSPLAQALAVAGQRGTLRKRLRGTTVDGRVLGKTGTLTQPPVVALSGFRRPDDSTLTFGFIQNGLKSDSRRQDGPGAVPATPRRPTAGSPTARALTSDLARRRGRRTLGHGCAAHTARNGCRRASCCRPR